MYFKQRFPLILLLLIFALPGASMADHSWGKFKWKGESLNLDLGDNVNSDWDGHMMIASNDWSVSTVVDTNIIPGATNPIDCNPQSGNIQVCNHTYGSNGWLGLAQIYGRGFTITAGLAKLNDTYFNTATYNTPAWRQMVMCQEVAHAFGLAHQDESFGNVNLGSCMDYTNDPDGTLDGELSNEHPNQHDFDQLVSIYAKDDGGGGGGGGGGSCNPKSPKCNPASTPGNSQWGRLMSGHGAVETYVRNLGGGRKVITFVTWTLEHADNHEH